MNGDLNVPGIDWDLRRTTSTSSRAASSVIDLCLDSVIWQNFRQPTSFRAGPNPSIVDLVFSRYEDEVGNLRAEAPLGRTDRAGINRLPASHQLYVKADKNNPLDVVQRLEWSHVDPDDLEGIWDLICSNNLWLDET